MKYTIDPLDHEDEPALSGPLVVQIDGPERAEFKLRAIADEGSQRYILVAPEGDIVGRSQTQLTMDVEAKELLDELRETVKKLSYLIASHELKTNGKTIEDPEVEAQHRTEAEFSLVLAYAILAVELEHMDWVATYA